MLCWGSWANMQKLASQQWRFQLFYWDYCLGRPAADRAVRADAGQHADLAGGSFCRDLGQASGRYIGYALLGGAVFNIANILLVAAIDIAGMAVAFPIGIGLALVIGVIMTYRVDPVGQSIDPVRRASPASRPPSFWTPWRTGGCRGGDMGQRSRALSCPSCAAS